MPTFAQKIVIKKAVLLVGNPVSAFRLAYVRTIQETGLE